VGKCRFEENLGHLTDVSFNRNILFAGNQWFKWKNLDSTELINWLPKGKFELWEREAKS